jgi:hypothetical protein
MPQNPTMSGAQSPVTIAILPDRDRYQMKSSFSRVINDLRSD